MSPAGVALLALALSACGGLPDAELYALTAPTAPPICPIDDGACESVPAPVIVEADAGIGHETAVRGSPRFDAEGEVRCGMDDVGQCPTAVFAPSGGGPPP